MPQTKLRLVDSQSHPIAEAVGNKPRTEAKPSSATTKSKGKPKGAPATEAFTKSGKPKAAKRAAPMPETPENRNPQASPKQPTRVKKREVTAADVMRSPAVCCRHTDPLNAAAQLMWEHDLGAIVVVNEHHEPISMITDRDVCMAAYTQGVPLYGGSVESAMAQQLVTCRAESSLSEIREKMAAAQLRRLPVIDAEGRLVGVVGLTDLLAEAATAPPKTRKRGSTGTAMLQLFRAVHVPAARSVQHA
jgi:CBS-domain-containing membrane protein